MMSVMSQSALHARMRQFSIALMGLYGEGKGKLKLNATLGAFAHAPLQKLTLQEPPPGSVRFDAP